MITEEGSKNKGGGGTKEDEDKGGSWLNIT